MAPRSDLTEADAEERKENAVPVLRGGSRNCTRMKQTNLTCGRRTRRNLSCRGWAATSAKKQP